MTRGSTTQTRTFSYDGAGRLIYSTNPESGGMWYSYNPDNTLNRKDDNKGQETVYGYDSQKRLTGVYRYPNGWYNPEDQCQRVTYSYDTNPYDSGFSLNSFGRLTAAAYGPTDAYGSSCIPVSPITYVEMYSYHAAGAVTEKRLQATRSGIVSNLDVVYGYDSAGRTSTVTYPMAAVFGSHPVGPTTFTYTFDSMGRPSGLTDNMSWTWAQNALYDFAGRPTSVDYLAAPGAFTTRSFGYNVNSQLTSLQWSGSGSVAGTIQYGFSASQNNGQITQAIDGVSGETIVYQYDALRRLTWASSTPTVGSTPMAWNQTFQYDGFGNLTAKVLNGTTTPIAVNAANNRLSSAYYDGNGNMTSGSGATLAYDVANRVASATEVSGGTEYYYYAPDNKRTYRLKADGITEEWTFYGAGGERLGVYSLDVSGGFTPLRTSVSFAGTLILDVNNAAYSDRTGSNRASGARFYPYGEEITSTGNDREKFATYLRDGFTGFDYADQRYYASTYGRFNTADPYRASGRTGDPGSWNRYAYTRGDPINRFDPRGTEDCAALFSDAAQAYDPYSPCSGYSGGNPCPYANIGMALQDDPDAPTFWAQAQAAGCTSYSAPIISVQQSSPPPVTCSVSLDTQSAVFQGDPFQHTFIQIGVDVDGNVSTEDLEAGPSKGFGGYLNNLNDPPNGGNFYPTTPSQLFTTGYSSGACSTVGQLDTLAAAYPPNTYPYFQPYNSNSFTYTLLTDAGVSIPSSASGYLTTPLITMLPTFGPPIQIIRAPGWGLLIPSWP